ncbi:MAG: hypothetical protein WBC91_08060 [Phototrophicaceae bacterium]
MITLISLILTLVIFSYLLDDNPLFRLAVSIFVGLAAAFTVSVTLQSVILPLTRSSSGDALILVFSGILTLLLLLKPLRSIRVFTNISLGFLIAVGVAVSIIGAISGTLIPIVAQTVSINSSDGAFNLLSSIVIVIGVISTLLYFSYGSQKSVDGQVVRTPLMQVVASIGQGFIVITLGALYGAAILTSLTILTGQLATLFGG